MTRFFQLKVQKTKNSINLYQSMLCISAAIAYFLAAIKSQNVFSFEILLPAVFFGFCFAITILFTAKCMEMGYMSISGVIINLSLILPVIYSWFILHEKIRVTSVIGLLLIIVTLVLSSISAETGKKGDMKKWLLFVSIAFFTNGGSAVTQKQYVSANGDQNLMLFMGIAYFVGAIILGAVYLNRETGHSHSLKEQVSGFWALFFVAIVSGLGSFMGNALLGFLSNKVNGGILYPCINGGLSVVVAIASFVLFKEKLNRKKIAAIVVGIIAIVLLNF